MSTSHDLEGLMKFLSRDKWRECFEEVFDDHFGAILEMSGMEFEDLAELFGDDWAMTLWGCAFEDFLTQDFEVEGGNIVDDYLKRRGWRENARTKAYMKALCISVMSLYEVSEVIPGQSFMARDLIRGGALIAVSDGTATKTLNQWDRIAARIMPVMDRNILAGGLLPFTRQACDLLFDGLRTASGGKKTKKLPAFPDEDLQEMASLFTLSWLLDALDKATGFDKPALQNTDGDELVFHDVRFPLVSGVMQKDIAIRLNGTAGLAQANPKFWNWLEDKPKAKGKTKNSQALSLDSMMESGQRVLGTVELKGRFLHLSTNSSARAKTGATLIGTALDELVRTPLTEIRTVEQVMAEQAEEKAAAVSSDILPEIVEQEAIHQLFDRHYRETLDQPVGMLNERTPRQAVRTPAGQRKVAEWLKYLENQSAGRPDPTNPLTTYNFEWMWKELGILDLRR